MGRKFDFISPPEVAFYPVSQDRFIQALDEVVQVLIRMRSQFKEIQKNILPAPNSQDSNDCGSSTLEVK